MRNARFVWFWAWICPLREIGSPGAPKWTTEVCTGRTVAGGGALPHAVTQSVQATDSK
jgi:hypothetical protein